MYEYEEIAVDEMLEEISAPADSKLLKLKYETVLKNFDAAILNYQEMKNTGLDTTLEMSLDAVIAQYAPSEKHEKVLRGYIRDRKDIDEKWSRYWNSSVSESWYRNEAIGVGSFALGGLPAGGAAAVGGMIALGPIGLGVGIAAGVVGGTYGMFKWWKNRKKKPFKKAQKMIYEKALNKLVEAG